MRKLFKRLIQIVVGLFALLLIIGFLLSPHHAPPPNISVGQSAEATSTSSASITPAAAAPAMPQVEQTFLQILTQASAAFSQAPNDMAKGAERSNRKDAICASIAGATGVSNWIGTVESMSSTSDGKGVLSVRLSEHATFSTTNNGLSEALGNHTLIQPGSPIYKQAIALHADQEVRFSARWFPSQSDCIEEGSVTQEGSLTDPDFRVRFTALTPVD